MMSFSYKESYSFFGRYVEYQITQILSRVILGFVSSQSISILPIFLWHGPCKIASEVRCACQSRSTRAETGHQPPSLQRSVALEISTQQFRFLGTVFCWVVCNLPLQSSRGNSEQIFQLNALWFSPLEDFAFLVLSALEVLNSHFCCSAHWFLLRLNPSMLKLENALRGGGEPWCECDTYSSCFPLSEIIASCPVLVTPRYLQICALFILSSFYNCFQWEDQTNIVTQLWLEANVLKQRHIKTNKQKRTSVRNSWEKKPISSWQEASQMVATPTSVMRP